MKNLNYFKSDNFFESASSFFKELNIPLKSNDEQAYRPQDFLSNTYNPKNPAHSLVDKAYLLGIVDDDAFDGESQYDSLEKISTITTDYEGLAVVGIELYNRDGDLLPTRSQLAEITRAVNREFLYTPVTVLFKYNGFLALANAERTPYLVKYKEGEKVGKVSLLRDLDFANPHTGHLQILNDLKRPEKIKTFTDLYKHWGEIFSVNVLNKKFYQELSNWYFWAIQNVTFPGQPTFEDATLQNKNFKDLKQQHNATNVIRMLTRLLFVWFMKEKKLIPEDLFELQNLQMDILNEIEPLHEKGLFTERNKDSVYYKAILQNLFFATLNCPIKSDSLDKRERGFRGEGYGTNRGIDYLMRYKKYFKDPEAFLAKVNDIVPFLNGGLFECLDDKFNNKYVDGFSDQMTKGEQLIVPDYLFFGLEEEADLSDVIGISDKKTKNSAVKGLINILKSYKFTITENTPIEEEVALDPELLGKVFENLLASYNPETKTTARKQTGSFYTPREIVNYMVDESLIAYLKNKIQSADVIITELGTLQSNLFGNEGVKGQASLMQQHSGSELKDNETLLDELLHQLVTYNSENPFIDYPETSKIILEHLDQCTILDPACGSGAFPMGILQKMVHILDKLDPDNKIWREVQTEKAKKESDNAFAIEDKQAREDLLIEINEAFDENINNPDYARKLFLIENCIYGVDIQPIATQISKLRFFISLVVEQKVDREKSNFGIRPLPNLETKLVAANTLIGIEKEDNLFAIPEIKDLEQKLRQTRNKLFNARTKDTKIKYRELDKQLRQEIAEKLIENGLPLASAEKLASWDPYNQNTSSEFFDPEWMFGLPKINGGFFDIVIGNPPYGNIILEKKYFIKNYKTVEGKHEIFKYFIEKGLTFLVEQGNLTYITPDTWTSLKNFTKLRKLIYTEYWLKSLSKTLYNVFEVAIVDTNIYFIENSKPSNKYVLVSGDLRSKKESVFQVNDDYIFNIKEENIIIKKVEKTEYRLDDFCEIWQGLIAYGKKGQPRDFTSLEKSSVDHKKLLYGGDIKKYGIKWSGEYLKYGNWLHRPRPAYIFDNPKILVQRIRNPQLKTRLVCALDKQGFLNGTGLSNILVRDNDGKIKLEYILAIINSKLINYWFHYYFTDVNIKPEQLRKIPICVSDEKIIARLEKNVSSIIEIKSNDLSQSTLDFEQEIDTIIYKIYDLTYDEVLLVEPDFKLIKEDYDKFIFQ
ncbi:Eco57I restriction-modification methylase domain-containing protein [Chryseobacterium sp. 8AT]|uniref:Eco57I restriction-modification methylase domain-containing protein n=1 Tax=Chryseobacterium sp. 8AT TaxID=2653134 RepID=UPI0012EFEBA4|nr:TaqI-like C-terminal specificity domain-containing protein [Chryseobacterium sp. 8AT]VXC43908.1 hypothetical protein CHRYSEO8AT_550061 [Chryseobacterium sp. 8AT]